MSKRTHFFVALVLAGCGGGAETTQARQDDDGPPIDNPLRIERDVTVDGMLSERFTWLDSAGKSRVAVLAHNDGQTGSNGSRGGELRRLDYEVNGQVRSVKADSNEGAAGFGYAVSHRGEGTSGIAADDSPLGHFFTGSFERVFEGRHHVVLRFRQNYPRYAATYVPNPNQLYDVPVVIDWVFSTGLDHPLWSITWDLSGVPPDALQDDSRAPYGELLFDGSTTAAAHSTIAGVSWSDSFVFKSTTNPVTLSSDWTYNQVGSVPFVKQWTTGVDATMGTVLTAPLVDQDAGGADLGDSYPGNVPTDLWNTTSANRDGCTLPGLEQKMPCTDLWPYQLNNYSFADKATPTNNTRLAWRTNFGFLGSQAYDRHGSDLPGVGWPTQSYSTFIVFGTHTAGPIERVVNRVIALSSVTATTTAGTAQGYDRRYAALTFTADMESTLDANIGVGVGPLQRPLIVVRDYASGTYPAITLNGATLVADIDFFASRRSASNELWVTLAKDLAGPANRLTIIPTP